jgi:hypothetical protein
VREADRHYDVDLSTHVRESLASFGVLTELMAMEIIRCCLGHFYKKKQHNNLQNLRVSFYFLWPNMDMQNGVDFYDTL